MHSIETFATWLGIVGAAVLFLAIIIAAIDRRFLSGRLSGQDRLVQRLSLVQEAIRGDWVLGPRRLFGGHYQLKGTYGGRDLIADYYAADEYAGARLVLIVSLRSAARRTRMIGALRINHQTLHAVVRPPWLQELVGARAYWSRVFRQTTIAMLLDRVTMAAELIEQRQDEQATLLWRRTTRQL